MDRMLQSRQSTILRSASSCIVDLFLTKQLCDYRRLLLASIQMATHDRYVCDPISRPALAEPVGFHVLIRIHRDSVLGSTRPPIQPQPRQVVICKAYFSPLGNLAVPDLGCTWELTS
jgi:hypothetical protein